MILIRVGAYQFRENQDGHKFYVSVAAVISILKIKDCSNTYKFSVYLKKYLTPATPYSGAFGSEDYYDFRSSDYTRRNPGYVPPYYRDFVEKYYKEFMKEVYPNLTAKGQVFLKRAGQELQRKIEERLNADPAAFAIFEIQGNQFLAFAYGMHPQVYCDSGWGDLPESDRSQIIRAIDFKDKYGPVPIWTSLKISLTCGFLTDVFPWR